MSTITHTTEGSIFLDTAIFDSQRGAILHEKALMLFEIEKQIKAQKLTSKKAAQVFGVSLETIELVKQGEISKLSLDTLFGMLSHAQRKPHFILDPLAIAA
jgi:predicted XRE-type DNA-binding protein